MYYFKGIRYIFQKNRIAFPLFYCNPFPNPSGEPSRFLETIQDMILSTLKVIPNFRQYIITWMLQQIFMYSDKVMLVAC